MGNKGVRGFGSRETIELPFVGGDFFGDHGYVSCISNGQGGKRLAGYGTAFQHSYMLSQQKVSAVGDLECVVITNCSVLLTYTLHTIRCARGRPAGTPLKVFVSQAAGLGAGAQ